MLRKNKNIEQRSLLSFIIIALVILGLGSVYFFRPAITGFIIAETNYVDEVKLVVTSNGSYNWSPKNIGNLQSLKLDGKVSINGKSKVYLESDGIRYLVFDSTRLNDGKEKADGTSLITGLAIKEDKDKNKKPEWNSDADEFLINGKTIINLSQYFVDKDDDKLIFDYSQVNDLDISLDNNIITITPIAINDFNATITLIASDGIDTINQVVNLIIIIENKTEENETNHAPEWNSLIDYFVLDKSLVVDLNDYFVDEDNDLLIFDYVDNEFIDEALIDGILNLTATRENINTTLVLGAFDGNLTVIKEITLIIPLTKSINQTNETIPIEIIINETNISTEKIIKINLSYNSGTVYDANDNGEESVNGVVDLTVSGTEFAWGADESKLCTRYEVYNSEEDSLTTFCSGNSDCCAFIGLLSRGENWNEVYYSTFGKDGTGFDNAVSAQVLYYDVNLSIENLKSEIYYSEWGNLSVKFYEDEIEFNHVCLETCSFALGNRSSYNLIFEVEDGAILKINNILYVTANEVPEMNITPLILSETRDFKPNEDIEFEFEYLSRQELVKQDKWKPEFEKFEKGNIESLSVSEGAAREKQKNKWVKPGEVIEADIFDSSNALKELDIEFEELREGKFRIKINNTRTLKAGRYRLAVNLARNGADYHQEYDFTWGVLASNFNKSMYLENDHGFISIGVLDDKGKIVCDADVTLKITDPGNETTTFSTSDNSIKISPECKYLGVTLMPDYYASYIFGGIGAYQINLTAITYNGVRSINDEINVFSSVAFDVARVSATRVYPFVPYLMNISIIANQDYSGLINEYVPASFTITPQEGMGISIVNETKILSWNQSLLTGDKLEIYYEYDTPDISPEFYLLGPLDIGNFKEQRQWQIANDGDAKNVNITFPDAGAPGMSLVVQFVGNFTEGNYVSTNSSGNITIGPIFLVNETGDLTTTDGNVLSTVFWIHPNATQQDVQVNVSGTTLSTPFKIISPARDSGNFSSAAAGTYMIGNGKNGTRTSRGTIVLDSLIIPEGVTINVNTTDLDPSMPGDQGYLPVHIIVDGPVNISGILNVSGEKGVDGAICATCGGRGGHGGPGGGGGGGGGSNNAPGPSGGNGLTGGGGGGQDSAETTDEGPGGNGTGSLGGAIASNIAGHGGNSTSLFVSGGTGGASSGRGGGGGGGTGFFFGSSGIGGGAVIGTGGSGGGGGAAHAVGSSGGGGGFGTNGRDNGGQGGQAHGNSHLVPLTGGSGGGGGSTGAGGGGGGGGGGAVLIYAKENITVYPTGKILTVGGHTGNITSGNQFVGFGGGGSGGAIVLQAFNVSILGQLNTSGGWNNSLLNNGTGGMGRIRVDGFTNITPNNIGVAGSNFTGPSIKNITTTTIGGTANASSTIIVYIQQKSGTNTTVKGTADANGQFEIAVTWYSGTNYIAVIQNSTVNTYAVLSSAAVATYDFATPVTDSCSCPGSGDWNINCADNCVISSNCDMQGNNIHSYGTGTLEVNALIHNFGIFANRCTFICRRTSGEGCFG